MNREQILRAGVRARMLTLVAYFFLLALIPLWCFWLSPPRQLPPVPMFLIWWLPLLFPLPGLLKGKAYTYSWMCFLLIIYFCHGLVTVAVSDGDTRLGLLETGLSVVIFLAAVTYLRSIRKLNA